MDMIESELETRKPASLTEAVQLPEEISTDSLPLVAMRGMSAFPGMVMHFDISREKSIQAVEAAMTQQQSLFITNQKNSEQEDPTASDLYPAGCLAKIKQTLRLPNGIMRVLVEIQKRAAVTFFLQESPYFAVSCEVLHCIYHDTKENEALLRLLRDSFGRFIMQTRRISGDVSTVLDMIEDPDRFVDLICTSLSLEDDDAQALLAETDLTVRMMSVYQFLSKEMEMVQIEQNITQKVKSEFEKSQREYFLREQIRVIRNELGDSDLSQRAEAYQERLDELDVADEVRQKVEDELSRLERVPEGSSECEVIETYLDWILNLPWNTATEEEIDVSKVRRVLNKDHYALDKVKERILEYIAVLKLSDNLKSPILCLVGPPGVGKTSIARSIAKALNRKYVRMSLGGIRDEAEIRGHRRTYVGAIPGRILYHLKQAGSNNPLFLLDEIDKMSEDYHGDPAAALLEVLDPEQNSSFTDNYLELPFDLSNILFLTTANSLSTIPRPLMDRMEIIEVNGYVEDEKYEIAKRYLVPKQLEVHGLTKERLKINKRALLDTIRYYTRESGVRELERQIARICRVAAKIIVEEAPETVSVTAKNLETFLGRHKFSFDQIGREKTVGLVNGLAWTEVGGEMLEIEAAVLPGKGDIEITGQLGDVMQESAKAAISYTRSKAQGWDVDSEFYKNNDVHIHVPEGAVPKDGPSAGITMTTALISALLELPVPQDLAMTGEITLRGRVLPIGGLREKLTAAHRAGIKKIILPRENLKDLEEVPKTVLDALDIHPVSTMEEVTKLVFGTLPMRKAENREAEDESYEI